jgi:hypothetical protein
MIGCWIIPTKYELVRNYEVRSDWMLDISYWMLDVLRMKNDPEKFRDKYKLKTKSMKKHVLMKRVKGLCKWTALLFLPLVATVQVNGQNRDVYSATSSVNQGYLTKWSYVGTPNDLINNSLIYDNGTNIGIGTQTPTYVLSLGGGTARTIGMERRSTTGSGFSLT